VSALLIADVHGAFDALADLAESGHDVIVLGDLVNLIDYRSCEGIVPDVVGAELIREVVALRMAGRDLDARSRWRDATATLDADIASGVAAGMARQYGAMSMALGGISGLVIHGNVDDPEMLRAHLPEGMEWADGATRTIDDEVFGFVGGGVPRIGTPGEVDDDTMRAKLSALGPVDVLCTHVPPAVPMLAEDTIGGRSKGSLPIREYLEAFAPRMHYYGDVHQPRATRMVFDSTLCVNVGYFRATHRGVIHTAHG